MSGSPWRQVQSALFHIFSLTSHHSLVKTAFIVYDSSARIIENFNDLQTISAGGGTNFQAAFSCIKQVLLQHKPLHSQGQIHEHVSICFMTDGRDNCCREQGDRTVILPQFFKQMMQESWINIGNITCHTVGFGQTCDKQLLEALRTMDGTFRYAEPGDGDEMLSSKLKTLFAKISETSSLPVTLDVRDCYPTLFEWYTPADHECKNDKEAVRQISFPIGADQCGVYTQWIEYNTSIDEKQSENADYKLNIKINDEPSINIPIVIEESKDMELYSAWILHITDEIATQIYKLSNKEYESYTEQVYDLHCAIIQQNINAIQDCVSINHASFMPLMEKIEYLNKTIIALRNGLNINMGKISDLRFASQFTKSLSKTATSNKHCDRKEQLEEKQRQLDLFADESKRKMRVEVLMKYPFNNEGTNRNILQQMIMDMRTDTDILAYLDSGQVTDNDIIHCDNDGNNTICLCSYTGKFNVLKALFARYSHCIDVSHHNIHQESALTLAIKKRGYYHTIRILLANNALIDDDRSEGLEQFAIRHNYIVTAKLIRDLRSNASGPTKFMTGEYVLYLYNDAMQNGRDIEVDKYLQTFLQHKMVQHVEIMLHKHQAQPTLDMLCKYCLPPKADHEETPIYLQLCKMLIENDQSLLTQRNNAQETALFKAAEAGSLPHCEYLIECGAEIDTVNELGNTPLWIATAKVYPCVMKLLIKHGANVNHQNIKGNPPLYNMCIRGNEKVTNILLDTRKCLVEGMINKNGDTLILICCRNKNWKILPLLLDHVSLDFVQFQAHIDGFNALFASVENNSVECIKLLHSFGVDINQKTSDDNAIIAGATALHLACFYKRLDAARVLLSLGADANITDNVHQQTPLTLAVMQLNADIIQLLARKTNVSMQDKYGNTALSYCHHNAHIRQLLVDPLLDVLCALSCNTFVNGLNKDAQQIACQVLQTYCGVPACLNTNDAVNIRDPEGMTPLMYAVLHKNADVVNVLLKLGADATLCNKYGINCFVFNQWMKNKSVEKHLGSKWEALSKDEQAQAQECVTRLQTMNDQSWFNSFTLHFGSNLQNSFEMLTYSGLVERMQSFANNIQVCNDDNKHNECVQLLLTLDEQSIAKKYDEKVVERVFQQVPEHKFDEAQYCNIVSNGRLFTINMIASNVLTDRQVELQAKDIFLMNLYTNNPMLSHAMNTVIGQPLANNDLDNHTTNILHSIKLLQCALQKLPCYVGEVFIGCNTPLNDRNKLMIGSTFSWNAMVSGSTQWRLAINHLPDFTTKKSQGTVFLVKSQTGKHIGSYSQFSFESEVVFRPDCKFRVAAWYRGDVICLAQKNIRQITFGIDMNEEVLKYKDSNKALIIEIEEVTTV